MTLSNQFFDAHPSLRFTVAIENLMIAAFTEFQLPTIEVKTESITEGGQNTYVHQLPVRVESATTLTLRHGIAHSQDLLAWYSQVLNGQMADAIRQVTVAMYGEDHQPLMIWNFRDAYPTKWVGPTLKSSDSAVLIEELTLVHHGFSVE
jgi:phage tail-like protein